jgi:hypothetical protein
LLSKKESLEPTASKSMHINDTLRVNIGCLYIGHNLVLDERAFEILLSMIVHFGDILNGKDLIIDVEIFVMGVLLMHSSE